MFAEYEKFLDQLREAVAAANKAEVARLAGVHRITLYNFLKGSTPTVEHAEALARAVGLAAPRFDPSQIQQRSEEISRLLLDGIGGSSEPLPATLALARHEARVVACLREDDFSSLIIAANVLLKRALTKAEKQDRTTRFLATEAERIVSEILLGDQ